MVKSVYWGNNRLSQKNAVDQNIRTRFPKNLDYTVKKKIGFIQCLSKIFFFKVSKNMQVCIHISSLLR